MKRERKKVRERGKLRLSRMFQKFKEGERVAIVRELGLTPKFPRRIQGKTGLIQGKRGKAYVVKIKDGEKEKQFIINPIHLKRIKTTK